MVVSILYRDGMGKEYDSHDVSALNKRKSWEVNHLPTQQQCHLQAFMVKVDQAEAEPTMAAEIATAVFMVVWFCQVQKQERATSKDLVVEPAKIFHTITS